MKNYKFTKQLLLLLPIFLSFASPCSFSGELTLPSNKRWIIIASRQTLDEAKLFAETYKLEFKDTSIFKSTNGWYAITIGIYDYPKDKYTLSQFISNARIPSDSHFAIGTNFELIKTAQKLPEARSLSTGEACIKKAVPHSVAGLVSGVVVDCLFFACGNTVIAGAIGLVTGGTQGCVQGVLDN